MKYRKLFLIILLAPACAFAQKFRIAGPPIAGYFYMDTVNCEKFSAHKGLRCIDIVSEYNVVVSSGKGRVIYCSTHSDRTYEIGIKYPSAVLVYTNIRKKEVFARQMVTANMPIGELAVNPKDKKFHLGLQVWQIGSPERTLWSAGLVHYLNGYAANDDDEIPITGSD